MYPKLRTYIRDLGKLIAEIPDERKDKLQKIADFVDAHAEPGKKVKLTYICTHNSRRSQFCQVWTEVLGHYLGVKNLQSFSGGTEVTAFNIRAVKTLERTGFKVENPGGGNPRYAIYFDERVKPLHCYSKKFDDPINPQKDFAAILTCSEADQNCPLVPGASFRISIPYRDPKEADGSPQETEIYDDKCQQIASEMLYLLTKL